MILLIDNYDSFVHNLARYLRLLGHATHVVRNDRITSDEARALRPDAIVLSPGPCTPSDAGICETIVGERMEDTPILGICLGHQAIAAALGGSIIRSTQPMHGRASVIAHDGRGVFDGLPSPTRVGRYHSLVAAADLPDCLEASAWTDDGTVMALRHRKRPLVGLQFHPESVLTEKGFELLTGFLRVAGLKVPPQMPASEFASVPPVEPYADHPIVPLSY